MQLAFLAGTALLIGLRKTSRFFFQWHKLRGSIFFFTGILLIILFGYTFIGLCVEAFGFVSLFGYVSRTPLHDWKHKRSSNTLFPLLQRYYSCGVGSGQTTTYYWSCSHTSSHFKSTFRSIQAHKLENDQDANFSSSYATVDRQNGYYFPPSLVHIPCHIKFK